MNGLKTGFPRLIVVSWLVVLTACDAPPTVPDIGSGGRKAANSEAGEKDSEPKETVKPATPGEKEKVDPCKTALLGDDDDDDDDKDDDDDDDKEKGDDDEQDDDDDEDDKNDDGAENDDHGITIGDDDDKEKSDDLEKCKIPETTSPETDPVVKPDPEPDPEPALNGVALYEKNCAMCHQTLAASDVSGAGVAGIKAAISSVGVMRGISLDDASLKAIADALK